MIRTAIATRLFLRLEKRVASQRTPDFVVSGADPDNPYLQRWWLIPRNRVFNVYLHKFLRDDDDRALHDHPWVWCSFLLAGRYIEHTIAAGGIHHRHVREAGSLKISGPRRAHRIELFPAWWLEDDFDEACATHTRDGNAKAPCWTLFITGPTVRRWGFHCPKGWVDFARFTKPGAAGETGAGCDG